MIARVTFPLPPLQTNSGSLNDENRLMSWVRPDRIGPIGSELCEWNTAAKRVVRPSTISSNTMSATASPLWLGTADALLSILATSAGRSRISSSLSSGAPVSGWRSVERNGRRCRRRRRARGGRRLHGRGRGGRRGRRGRVGGRPRRRRRLQRRVRGRRGRQGDGSVSSEFSQEGDALIERRVGIEQSVDAAQLAVVADATHGLLDPQVCRSGGRSMRHRRVGLELLERRDQTGRVSGELAGADIGQCLAAASRSSPA